MPLLFDPEDPPSKRQILSSALTLFVREGLCETSIRAIADASGYTNPALYKFFDSKDALALHLFERCYLGVYEQVKTALAKGTFEERLGAVVTAWVEALDERLEAVLFVNEWLRDFWPRARPTVRRRSLLKELAELVLAGQREGRVPATLDPELGMALIVGTLGQAARQRFFGGFVDSARLRAQLTALLLAALTRSTP